MRLEGESVVLRAIERADLDSLCDLFAEPAVSRWWPRMDRERVRRELIDEIDDDLTPFAIEVDGDVAGLIQAFEEPDPEYKQAGIDIAVHPRWHGTGVAVDALRTLVAHLIHDRGHHHLTIDPAAGNARAIACYRKVGFRDVGILRQHELGPDGTFHDALLMDLIADDLD